MIEGVIAKPVRTVTTRDTRNVGGGVRNNDPATGYIDATGNYVVRNDRTGDIVQISNRNDPSWIAPW